MGLGGWPIIGLDIDLLRRQGFQPQAFNQFVIKIHSRCNLACDYCYVYAAADRGWLDQPLAMAPEVVDSTLERIREHVTRFGQERVSIVLHGGEPLLATKIVGGLTRLDLGIQTNGVLLDEAFLDIFDRWSVRVGVSIDGGASDHDRHRRYQDGRGSYDQVVAALERLARPDRRQLYAGLLAAIDISANPITTYESLVDLAPPAVDFLLPHGNWAIPPPGRVDGAADTPYGDWLIAIFDRWFTAERLETRVRLFNDIIALLIGRSTASETVGVAPIRLVVVETNGRVEQVDVLKSAYAGATSIDGLGSGNPFDLALWHPGVVARQLGVEALSATCRACPVQSVCGGGHYAHRYHPRHGFLQPSVYCHDLAKLITHIAARVRADVARPDGRSTTVHTGS
jgi:uncharacterized protein